MVGILDKKGQTTWGQDQDDIIVVPLTTAKRKVLGVSQANARAVNSISVRVRDGADIKEAEAQTRELLRQRHRLQGYQDDDFSIRNLAEIAEAQEASSRVMTVLLAAVASVSLFVGGRFFPSFSSTIGALSHIRISPSTLRSDTLISTHAMSLSWGILSKYPFRSAS